MVGSLICNFMLFAIGLGGIIITRKNFIIILMALEIMLLALNLNFLFFSSYLDDLSGEVFALFILTIAAAESAIGLALLILFYRLKGSLFLSKIRKLKG